MKAGDASVCTNEPIAMPGSPAQADAAEGRR